MLSPFCAHQTLNRRFILLMGAAVFMTSACTSKVKTGDRAIPSAAKAVKQVQHAFGETEIPAHPTRVIVLGSTMVEAVMAHGVQPIGVFDGLASALPHLSLDGETTSEIGNPMQPNLEKMAVLKPDLILTNRNMVGDAYSLLSQIAPTVVLDIDSNAYWKDLTRLCGEALGKPAETKKLAAAYEAKLQQVRAQFSKRPKQFQVSIVSIFPGYIQTHGKESFPGSVLADAGILRPPSQAHGSGSRNISLEALDLLDGDVMFIIRTQSNDEWGKEIRTEIDRIKAQPLWSQLKTVKTNQVYEVNYHWMIGSYISANLILDDLLKYLVEHR